MRAKLGQTQKINEGKKSLFVLVLFDRNLRVTRRSFCDLRIMFGSFEQGISGMQSEAGGPGVLAIGEDLHLESVLAVLL